MVSSKPIRYEVHKRVLAIAREYKCNVCAFFFSSIWRVRFYSLRWAFAHIRFVCENEFDIYENAFVPDYGQFQMIA